MNKTTLENFISFCNTMQIVDESYIVSKEDIMYNVDKYKDGQINVCFIIGHSGSGKSTLARDLFDKDDKTVSLISLDNIIWNECLSLEEWKERGEVQYQFFKGIGKKYFHISNEEIRKTYKSIDEINYPYKESYEYSIIHDFIKFALKYASNYPEEHFIIEGIWTFLFMEPEEISNYAVIIKGTSFFTSYFRAFKRDWKNKETKNGIDKVARKIKKLQWVTHDIKWEKLLRKFRKYFS